MIVTPRLLLVPATVATLDAARSGSRALGAVLQAFVPTDWPHEGLDEEALAFVRRRVDQGPAQQGWWLSFAIARDVAPRTLVGSAGFMGPPDADGTVELGYGIVASRQRRGYASEAAAALVAQAFDDPRVRRVVAHTLPALAGSIGVLGRCGFRHVGPGADDGEMRYELARGASRGTARAGTGE